MTPHRRRRNRIILLVLGLMTVVGIGIGLLMWSERNTAHTRSEFIVEFAASTDTVLYCGNGYGLGVFGANEHPWWEWTLLGSMDPEDLASDLEAELEGNGFDIEATTAHDSAVLVLEGQTDADLTVTAQIDHQMPQNNCFPDFGDVINEVEPYEYPTAAVVLFRDEGRSR